jgi:hypothetical protein
MVTPAAGFDKPFPSLISSLKPHNFLLNVNINLFNPLFQSIILF